MYYDPEPQYHNPPSNQWFGYQTWPMERVAEYYYETGNAQAKAILDKWVTWAESVATFNTTTGAICLPGTLSWTGQPSARLHLQLDSAGRQPRPVASRSPAAQSDLGVSASLAKVYAYYAAKSGNTTAETAAQNILDVIHKFYADSLGFSAPETRTDYKNFTRSYSTTGQEGVFIPASWTGTYPGGIKLSSSTNTFLSLRPWYTSDPRGLRSRPTWTAVPRRCSTTTGSGRKATSLPPSPRSPTSSRRSRPRPASRRTANITVAR